MRGKLFKNICAKIERMKQSSNSSYRANTAYVTRGVVSHAVFPGNPDPKSREYFDN